MSVVTMKQLLESGVHFGHQTHKWNPKMKKFIFIKRNGIHILDLKQTVDCINNAYMFLKEIAQRSGFVLFVGTKKQARASVEESAKKCEAFYVSHRWYGGMLTNMQTIRKSITKLQNYENLLETEQIANYTKLEATKMKRKYDKILNSLGGIRGMNRKPDAVVVVDTITEDIAIKEANKLHIPVVALVDTNSDPDMISYPIPSNDDAIRSISLIFNILADAVLEGKNISTEGAGDIKLQEKEELNPQQKDVSSEKQIEIKETNIKKAKEKKRKVKPVKKTEKAEKEKKIKTTKQKD